MRYASYVPAVQENNVVEANAHGFRAAMDGFQPASRLGKALKQDSADMDHAEAQRITLGVRAPERGPGNSAHAADHRPTIASLLEPAMLAVVDLHQLAQTFTLQPRLVQAAPLLAQQPEAGRAHPAPQRLERYCQLMVRPQHPGRQGRTKIRAALPHQAHGQIEQSLARGPARTALATLVAQARRAVRPLRFDEPLRLPPADPQGSGPPPHGLGTRLQHLDPGQLALAHQDSLDGDLPRSAKQGSVPVLLGSGGTFQLCAYIDTSHK
jgi:hypothetical protein